MAALLVDGKDTVKGGGRDIEPLGNGNIIFHILVHLAAADAVYLDTSSMSFDDSVKNVCRLISEKTGIQPK